MGSGCQDVFQRKKTQFDQKLLVHNIMQYSIFHSNITSIIRIQDLKRVFYTGYYYYYYKYRTETINLIIYFLRKCMI